MRYFIIAGEQSGDLHGSNLVKGLVRSDPEALIECWGGDLMQAAGARLLKHYRDTAFMGFVSVVKNLGKIAKNLASCKKDIIKSAPDVIILIDYPGFNLRIAEFASKNGYKVFYYISPKFWAWKENRVEKIKKYTDRIFIIFPFEVDFYKKHGMSVEYHGNPLVDEIEYKISSLPGRSEIMDSLNLPRKPVIALLAGSRKNEIEKVLPQMIKVVRHFPGYQFVLAGVKNIHEGLYTEIIGNEPITLVKEKTYEILSVSSAALVTSGTATLETALLNIPQVVCFKGDLISMLIAWSVIKVKYISLVNLIMNKEVVRELIQFSLSEKNLVSELQSILPGGTSRETLLVDYATLRERLGKAGASDRIAEEMVRELRKH